MKIRKMKLKSEVSFFPSEVTYSLQKLQNSELKLILTSYIQNSSK